MNRSTVLTRQDVSFLPIHRGKRDATAALIAIALVIFVIGCFQLLLGFYLRAIFLFYLILRAKPDIMAPLMIATILPQLDFGDFRTGYGSTLTADRTVGIGLEQYANTLPFLLIPIRTAFALAKSSRTGKWIRPLFAAWAVGLVPVIFATVRDYLSGEAGWTTGLRQYGVVCSVLYAGALFPRPISPTAAARNAVLALCLVVLATANLQYFSSKLVFVLDPLAVALGIWLVWQRKPSTVILGGALLGVSLIFSQNATLTILSTWVLTALFCFARCAFPGPSGSGFSKRLAQVALVLSIAVVGYGIYFGASGKVDRSQGTETLEYRIQYKFFRDRAPLWIAAWTDIIQEPRIVGKNNEGFRQSTKSGQRMWKSGSHNTYLELIQRLGWLAGLVGVAVFLAGVAGAMRAAATPGLTTYVACIYLAAAAFMIMNGASGHWPVGTEVGYIPLMMAGAGLYQARSGGRTVVSWHRYDRSIDAPYQPPAASSAC